MRILGVLGVLCVKNKSKTRRSTKPRPVRRVALASRCQCCAATRGWLKKCDQSKTPSRHGPPATVKQVAGATPRLGRSLKEIKLILAPSDWVPEGHRVIRMVDGAHPTRPRMASLWGLRMRSNRRAASLTILGECPNSSGGRRPGGAHPTRLSRGIFARPGQPAVTQ
jgi:hypothetical protein